MLLSNDNGVPGFGETYVVTGNEVEMENGNAAFALGSSIPVAILKDAVISNNRISGTAKYGVLSLDGAQNCPIAAMTWLTLRRAWPMLASMARTRTTTR